MEGEASGSFDDLLMRTSEAVRDVDPEISIMVHRVLEQVINGNIKKIWGCPIQSKGVRYG